MRVFEWPLVRSGAKDIIRDLESELARKDARIAELEARLHQTERKLDQVRRGRDAALAHAEKAERERDEARRIACDLHNENAPSDRLTNRRDCCARYGWDEAHLFQEES